MMVHSYEINDIPLKTGDIICTMNGKPNILPGEFWRLVGMLVPGDVDHVAIYIGPGGRCVEAGALGVITFEVSDGRWDAEHSMSARGMLVDTFYGVAYPLQDIGLTQGEEAVIREGVAAYCLAQVGRPYNLLFSNPDSEAAFYCSQLAYKAYLPFGIDLNIGTFVERMSGVNRIVYPQEIWEGCAHVMDKALTPDEPALQTVYNPFTSQ